MESDPRPGAAGRGLRTRVSFLVPAFNEERTIGAVLERVRQLPFDKQIVVVDDGSTDGTADALRAAAGDDLLVLRQENRGKGAALRAAINLPVTDALAAARFMHATTLQRAYAGAY